MKNVIKALGLLATLLFVQLVNAQQYNKVTYVHSDPDGTPFAATDSQGNIEWQIDHFPYGKEYENTEVARKSDISFAGKPYDEEIGLSYFGGRWYDPDLGRFTSIDPMPVNPEDYRTYNRYAYVFNNPYKYVDPDGNLPFLIPIAIFIAKEIAAEAASRATGGATDFLSVRRGGTRLLKGVANLFKGNPRNKLCFVEGTLVHTQDGLKAIESIQLGDLVLSKDEVLKQSSYKTVTQLYVNEDKPVLDIGFINSDGRIESFGITPEHPVWVVDTGWVEAGNLKVGDYVDSIAEGNFKVHSVSQRAQLETTYNIEVEDYHTYFVGNSGLWVHNMCTGEKTERLRHFTNSKGAEGIKNDGVIKASDQNRVFTEKAKGNPGSPREVEGRLGIGRGRGNNIVEFDAKPSEFTVVRNGLTGATERVFKGNVNLKGRKAKIKKNR